MSSLASVIDSPSVPFAPRHRGAAAVVVLAGACLLLAGRAADPKITSQPAANPLVHWHDSHHDWLLVADRAAHELVVYDAATGAPLQRLGSDDGVGRVDSIVPLGDRLLVQDAKGRPTLLSLPDLRAGTLVSR